jgi:hypothetical protein
MQIFGLAGMVCFGAGGVLSICLAYQKLFHGAALSDRPLLLLGVLLIVIGIQLASIGLVADVLTRTYFESQKKPSYYVRKVVRSEGTILGAAPSVRQVVEPMQ